MRGSISPRVPLLLTSISVVVGCVTGRRHNDLFSWRAAFGSERSSFMGTLLRDVCSLWRRSAFGAVLSKSMLKHAYSILAPLDTQQLGFGVPYFNTFFLNGTLMKHKFIRFSPWLLKSPDKSPLQPYAQRTLETLRPVTVETQGLKALSSRALNPKPLKRTEKGVQKKNLKPRSPDPLIPSKIQKVDPLRLKGTIKYPLAARIPN